MRGLRYRLALWLFEHVDWWKHRWAPRLYWWLVRDLRDAADLARVAAEARADR